MECGIADMLDDQEETAVHPSIANTEKKPQNKPLFVGGKKTKKFPNCA
jgi:hypothetical protein